ncbi:MAG: PEGA domain-containing protein [Deltaproteobacteria bacterium]|nr:PEGA domain-containing protein [Deltaproteobacteria bacterium]
MRTGVCAVVAAAVLTTVLPPGVALAQGVEGKKQDAKRLRDRGTEAFDAREYAAALQYFEDAYRAYPTPVLKFNMALALEKLDRPADTLEAFEAFLAEAKEADSDARAYAATRVPGLEQRVGTLVVATSAASAEVAVDGKVRGTTPLPRPLRVAPGRHRVVVSKAGHRSFTSDFTAKAGETQRLFPELRAIETSRPERARPSFAKRHTGSLITGGVAVVIAGVATGLGVSTWSTYKDLSGRCAGTATGCASGDIDGVKNRALITNIMYGAAGAAAVTAAILFYVEHRRASKLEVVVLPTLGGGTLLVRY